MAPIELVLSRLEKVRQRQDSQWSACCPSHRDKSPSLSVRETEDGGVLIHCFAGCSFQAVVDSLGINLSELFPPRFKSGKEPKRTAKLLTSSQALELLEKEANFIAIAAINLKNQMPLTESDLIRCIEASQKISELKKLTGARYE